MGHLFQDVPKLRDELAKSSSSSFGRLIVDVSLSADLSKTGYKYYMEIQATSARGDFMLAAVHDVGTHDATHLGTGTGWLHNNRGA